MEIWKFQKYGYPEIWSAIFYVLLLDSDPTVCVELRTYSPR